MLNLSHQRIEDDMDELTRKCLLGIIQRGITEARSCALSGHNKATADLLDALDNIPRHLAKWMPDSEREIAVQLETFQKQHPNHATDYAAIFKKRRQTLY